jgi:hypothetical protein
MQRGSRPIVYPPSHEDIYKAGLGIKDKQVRAFYYLAYLAAARRGELCRWTRTFRNVYKKDERGRCLKGENGKPILEARIPLELPVGFLGVRKMDFGQIEKPCCMRPSVSINKLKQKTGKFEERIAVLEIDVHHSDLYGRPSEEVQAFFEVDRLCFEIVREYLESFGANDKEPLFSYSAGKMYRLLRGNVTREKGKYLHDSFYGGLGTWKTRVKYPEGARIEERTINPHQLRIARVTNLFRLGFRDTTVQALTGHSRKETLEIYKRFMPEEQAKTF